MDKATIKETINGQSDKVRSQFTPTEWRLDRINERVINFVQDHPAASLLGAAVLGYFVARIARRQSYRLS